MTADVERQSKPHCSCLFYELQSSPRLIYLRLEARNELLAGLFFGGKDVVHGEGVEQGRLSTDLGCRQIERKRCGHVYVIRAGERSIRIHQAWLELYAWEERCVAVRGKRMLEP